MNRKVSLKPPTRPQPTTGYVRQAEEMVVEKPVALAYAGGRAHAPTPPMEGVGSRGAAAAAGGGCAHEAAGIETVVAQWRALSPADRKHCLALIALEAQKASPGEDRDRELWSEAVHEVLQAALGPSDSNGHGPQVIRRLMGVSSAWGPVAEVCRTIGLTDLKPAERFAAFRLLAVLLVGRAKRVADHTGIPLTPKLVASNAVHMAGIFDNAFPGYLAGGLGRVVVRQAASGRLPLMNGRFMRDDADEQQPD